MPWREANHHSFDCGALEQVKRLVESRNSVPSPMFAFAGSIPPRCCQTVRPKQVFLLVLWLNSSWSKRWRCTFDPTFESGRRRKARGAPLFNQEDLDEINPSTGSVAFDTLLQDESLSEDVGEIMRMKYGWLRRVSSRVVKDRGKVLGHAGHVHTSLVSKSWFWLWTSTRLLLGTWRMSRLSSISRWPFFSPSCWRCWQFWWEHTFFLVTVCFSSGSRGNSRVLGIVVIVFGTIQRRLACPCAVAIPINREVLSSFMLHSLSDVVCLFPLFTPKGGHFAFLYPATDMSRWSLISSIGSVVDLPSWDHWWVVAKPENSHRAYFHLIDSHSRRSIHARVVHRGQGRLSSHFITILGNGPVEERVGTTSRKLNHVEREDLW